MVDIKYACINYLSLYTFIVSMSKGITFKLGSLLEWELCLKHNRHSHSPLI